MTRHWSGALYKGALGNRLIPIPTVASTTQALLLLIANGRPPDAITTVFGNVDLDGDGQHPVGTRGRGR
jgi:hypothetical protein